MARTTQNTIILEELRIIQSEMKSANGKLERLSTIMDAVETQTTRTNGRVTKLEDRMNFHRGGIYVAYIGIGLIIAALTLLK